MSQNPSKALRLTEMVLLQGKSQENAEQWIFRQRSTSAPIFCGSAKETKKPFEQPPASSAYAGMGVENSEGFTGTEGVDKMKLTSVNIGNKGVNKHSEQFVRFV